MQGMAHHCALALTHMRTQASTLGRGLAWAAQGVQCLRMCIGAVNMLSYSAGGGLAQGQGGTLAYIFVGKHAL